MSFSISFNDLTEEIKQYLNKRCIIKKTTSIFDPTPEEYRVIRLYDKIVHIPFALWSEIMEEFPNTTSKCDIIYRGPPLLSGDKDQDVIVQTSINKLKRDHYVFLALATSFGKTLMAVYISCILKRKVLVLCHLTSVTRQWADEYINKTTTSLRPTRVQFVSGEFLDPTADVYIMGILKASNFNFTSSCDIGTIIIDEAHIATKTCFTITLLKLKPEYLIGLSATPDRNDGLHKIFELYFGSTEGFIVRNLIKSETTVIRIDSKFTPTISYTISQGKYRLDWTKLQNSLSYNPERQKFIIELVLQRVSLGDKILVLCGRVKEAESLLNMLDEYDVSVTTLFGSDKIYDADAQILIATSKKAGVGFNHPSLTTMILTFDFKDIRQIEGRLRTFNGTILDIVDNNPILHKHWEERRLWYTERGEKVICSTPTKVTKNLRPVEDLI